MSLISKRTPLISLVTLLAFVTTTPARADTDTSTTAGLGSFGGGGYTVTGNTGSMGYPIPIEVPEGHHGLTPGKLDL